MNAISNKNLPNLFDLSLTTTLNNLLDILENRFEELDRTTDLDDLDLQDAIQIALRTSIDYNASRQLIQALQRVNVFYAKYRNTLKENAVKRLEHLYLTYLKNRIIYAMSMTMQKFDSLAIKLSAEALTKMNIIKSKFTLHPAVLDKIKKIQTKGDL